jgi:hypothetical protein
MPLFMMGILAWEPFFIQLAVIAFAGVLLFHVVTLPVEINAPLRLRPPDTLRNPLVPRGGRHLACAHGGGLYIHSGC